MASLCHTWCRASKGGKQGGLGLGNTGHPSRSSSMQSNLSSHLKLIFTLNLRCCTQDVCWNGRKKLFVEICQTKIWVRCPTHLTPPSIFCLPKEKCLLKITSGGDLISGIRLPLWNFIQRDWKIIRPSDQHESCSLLGGI